MTSLGDVMKALREVIVMNEKVTTLAGLVDKLATESIETRERLVRVETVLEIAFKAPNRGQALPGPLE